MQPVSEGNKTIAVNTVFLYIRLLFTLVVGLIVSRIVLQTLGVEDYGIYTLVGGFVALLSMFTFSISGTCQRFLVYELGKGNSRRLSETFCTISLLVLGFVVLFFVIAGGAGCWFIANVFNIPEGKTTIAIIVFLCSLSVFCIQLFAIPYTSVVVAHEKMSFYALMSILEAVAKLVVVISLYYVPWNKLIYYAMTLVAISLCSMFAYRFYCKSNFKEAKFHWIFNKGIFKDIISFTIWVGLGASAGLLKDQGGSILLNLFFGVTLNAACGIANQVKSVVSQLSTNVGLAISPQITKSYSSGDIVRSISLTFVLTKIQCILVLLIALPIIFETPILLELWLGDVPPYTIGFVRAILVLGVLQTLEQSYGPLFLAVGKVKHFQIVASIITLTVLPFTYILYYCGFHPATYYFVCIGVEVALFLYGYRFLSLEINFPLSHFFLDVILRLLLTTIITILFVEGIYLATNVISNDYFKMIINVSICVMVFLAISFMIALNKNERHIVMSYVKAHCQRLRATINENL